MSPLRLPPTVLVVTGPGQGGEDLGRRLTATGLLTCVGVVSQREDVLPTCERRQPAVVLLDLRRPDALELLEELSQRSPRPVVVLSADAQSAAAAVRSGAVEAVAVDADALHTAELLVLMSRVPVVRRFAPRVAAESTRDRLAIVAASTGGPIALRTVLAELPAELSVPVLVVQHMPAGFAPTFAEWLGQGLPLPVRVAPVGELLQPGTVLVVPDSVHAVLDGSGVLRTEPPRGAEAVPSADRLFASATGLGRRVFAALLTGMGRDGAEGLLALRKAGGATVVQNEASSVVFGMPAAALEMGAALESMTPEQIGRRLASWALARPRN